MKTVTSKFPQILFMGYPLTIVNDELMVWIQQVLAHPSFLEIVTLNPEMIVINETNHDLKRYIQHQTLCVADGMALTRAFRWVTGQRLARTTGIDLCECLFKIPDIRCYFVGGTERTMTRSVVSLQQRFPGLQVVGYHHGYYSENEEQRIMVEIEQKKPDLILAGLGYPKQTHFIQRVSRVLDRGIAIGVGGVFEIFSNEKPRAPRWVQAAGFEWLFRGIIAPKRIRRWGFIPKFLIAVVKEKWRVTLKRKVRKGFRSI